MSEITTTEAANKLKIVPRLVRKAFAEGKIRGRKVNDRLTMLDAASVDAYGRKLADSRSKRTNGKAHANGKKKPSRKKS